jgi:hypothetical protein
VHKSVFVQGYSDSAEGQELLAQAKARIALLHDDESMQRALSIQTKAKRMLAVAASSEEVKQLQAQSQGMWNFVKWRHRCASVVGNAHRLPRAMCSRASSHDWTVGGVEGQRGRSRNHQNS